MDTSKWGGGGRRTTGTLTLRCVPSDQETPIQLIKKRQNAMFDNNSTTIHSILDLYQQCRRNGDWARMYLETQDGREYFNISICPSAGKPAGVAEEEKVKTKKPSQVRRDRFRRASFLERKQCQKTESVSATNKIKDEEENKVEEKETMESVAGETRPSELSEDEKKC